MWFQRLFGDTAEFALRVGLMADPAPAAGMAELKRWSWGALEIWVRGRCLTRSVRLDGSSSDAVIWYMLPLLRWVLRRGAALLNEEPFPGRVEDDVASGADWLELSEQPPFTPLASEEDRWFEARSDWFQRHALRAAADGGVFPHVVLRRLGDDIEVSWDHERHPATRRDIHFVEPCGSALVRATAVSDAIGTFVSDTAGALATRTAEAGQLVKAAEELGTTQEDWRFLLPAMIAETLERSAAYRSAVAELRRAATDGRRGLLVPHTRTSYLLRSAPPSPDPNNLAGIMRLTGRRGAAAVRDSVLWKARSTSAAPAKDPWRPGHEAALDLRHRLGWGDGPAPDLQTFLSAAGIEVVVDRLDATITGGTLSEAERMPIILRNSAASGWLAPRPETSIAHELGHVLMDAPADADFAVLSTPWAHWPSEARANAFAIMLLMPEGGIRGIVARHGALNTDAVKDLMQTYGVGPVGTTWHLRNLRFISEEARLDLLQQLTPHRDAEQRPG